MRGLCILFSVLLVLMMMAGMALYLDPGDSSGIVEEDHDDMTTSDDKTESVTEESELKNITELNSTKNINSTVIDTSEEPSNNNIVEATKVVDLNNIESWSSSMAGIDSGLTWSTRGREHRSSALITTHY